MNDLPEICQDYKNMAIRFDNLTRRFGDFIAVNSINLNIRRGSFFGFLGPNGAGKSTTINMLIGLIKPTSGKIYIEGMDVEKHPIEVKRSLGVVPEILNLYERLKSREYLELSGMLYGLSHSDAIKRSNELLELLEIDKDKFIIDLSQGMKKKVSLGAAIIHNPDILVLDEPFITIDAISARKIKDILLSMVASGVTIFMTSHVLEVVEKLCTDVAIIHHGKIILTGTVEELLKDGDMKSDQTLEDVFVKTIGADLERGELSWIK
jgi:ABC-2 type transport system ATP-binding protein